jgi:hypothetical protein
MYRAYVGSARLVKEFDLRYEHSTQQWNVGLQRHIIRQVVGLLYSYRLLCEITRLQSWLWWQLRRSTIHDDVCEAWFLFDIRRRYNDKTKECISFWLPCGQKTGFNANNECKRIRNIYNTTAKHILLVFWVAQMEIKWKLRCMSESSPISLDVATWTSVRMQLAAGRTQFAEWRGRGGSLCFSKKNRMT